MPIDPYKVNIDTTYLRFNPNKDDFVKTISAEIPAFEDYNKKDVNSPVDKRRIYAWIVSMYDMNSPLRRDIKDMYKRKVQAGVLSGIVIQKISGKYKKFIEDMLIGKNKDINVLIVKFIASFASPEYMQLMGTMALQHNIMNKIISGDVSKDNQQILENTTATISRLTNILYGTGERDEIVEAKRALYKQVSYDLSDMRPENAARMMEVDGELPDDWNPYESGYLPGDINFVGDDPLKVTDDESKL